MAVIPADEINVSGSGSNLYFLCYHSGPYQSKPPAQSAVQRIRPNSDLGLT